MSEHGKEERKMRSEMGGDSELEAKVYLSVNYLRKVVYSVGLKKAI